MKMKSARTVWLGIGMLLALCIVALVTLKQIGVVGMAERSNSSGGADRAMVSAKGNQMHAPAEVSARDSQASHAVELPIHHAARDRTAEVASVKPEAPTVRDGSPSASEVPKSRPLAAERSDMEDGAPEQHPVVSSPTPPPGIRLAPDVRLPVAALPIDFQTNEVTARMLDLIVSDYYRDLAAGVAGEGNANSTTRLEEDGGETILVRNGPVAEAARQRADWRFRTIFGKAAFNRMSMQSNLEARLPVAAGE